MLGVTQKKDVHSWVLSWEVIKSVSHDFLTPHTVEVGCTNVQPTCWVRQRLWYPWLSRAHQQLLLVWLGDKRWSNVCLLRKPQYCRGGFVLLCDLSSNSSFELVLMAHCLANSDGAAPDRLLVEAVKHCGQNMIAK